jgi:hypothetical protein
VHNMAFSGPVKLDPGAPITPQAAVDGIALPMSFRRSSWCSANSCVEVAAMPDGGVAVRDGKSPDVTPVLMFSADEWTAFISGVKAGEFG